MDYEVFEARVRELGHRSGQRVTPPLVAYSLGCTIDLAKQHLDRMVSAQIASREIDERGFLYYEVPGLPPPTREPLSWQQGAVTATAQPIPPPIPPPSRPRIISLGHAPPSTPYTQLATRSSAPAAVVSGEKSAALAFVLGLLLGPIGMLYATVGGALVMFIVNLMALAVTAGAGLLLTIPIGAVWAAMRVSEDNARRRDGVG